MHEQTVSLPERFEGNPCLVFQNAKRVLPSSTYQSHNDTIFVFYWGKKNYIYISLYINVYMQTWVWGETPPPAASKVEQHHRLPSDRETREITRQRLTCRLESVDRRWEGLQACMRQTFTGLFGGNSTQYLLFDSLDLLCFLPPRQLLLSQTLVSAFAI